MPLVLAFLLLLLPALALGQGRLGGVVQDSVTHQPLAFASVFLANTTLGVTTNEQGKFELAGVPLGRHHLVASYVGYRLAQRTIVVEETTQQVLLRLAPAAQLGEVVVRPRANQEADYARFKELFIGHTSFSSQCRILNPKDLLLDYDAKTTQLTAAAIKYLEIENAALGYRLKYYGLRLSANFAQHQVAFLGQPLFEEMPSRSKLQQRRWQANRAIAYRGSLRHFLKSVYEDSLAARGFYVRRLRLVPNYALANRDSLKSLLVAEKRRNEGVAEATPPPPWAPEQKGFVLAYFRPLPADSLRHTSADKQHVFLHFTGYVQVDYLREGPDPYFTYLAPISRSRPLAKGQISRLLLLEPGVEITADGQLASPHAFLVDSYWSFEKIGEFLPFDYQLPTSTPVSAPH